MTRIQGQQRNEKEAVAGGRAGGREKPSPLYQGTIYTSQAVQYADSQWQVQSPYIICHYTLRPPLLAERVSIARTAPLRTGSEVAVRHAALLLQGCHEDRHQGGVAEQEFRDYARAAATEPVTL